MTTLESSSRFLRTGLRLLRAEFPESFSRISTRLETIPGVYDVGDERFTVTAAEGRISVRAAQNTKELRVQASCDPRAILEVVDGTCSVQRLLEQERLVIVADTDAMLALNEVVRLFARAAIRSSTLQRHFEKYRRWVLGG